MKEELADRVRRDSLLTKAFSALSRNADELREYYELPKEFSEQMNRFNIRK